MDKAKEGLLELYNTVNYENNLLRNKRLCSFQKGKRTAYRYILKEIERLLDKEYNNTYPKICVHYNADSYEHKCFINADTRYCSENCAWFKEIRHYISGDEIKKGAK